MSKKNYENFYDLRDDMCWFAHNCRIAFSGNTPIRNSSKELISYIDEEISSVKKCTQCYHNAFEFPENAFVMRCDAVHKVIWAKLDGFNYWPAKLMPISDKIVDVRFFGDHTNASVNLDHCYLYSKNPPDYGKKAKKCLSEIYTLALKVSQTQCQMVKALYLLVSIDIFLKGSHILYAN